MPFDFVDSGDRTLSLSALKGRVGTVLPGGWGIPITGFNQNQDVQKRAAIRVVKIIVRTALRCIPKYGEILEGGLEVAHAINEAREEIRRRQEADSEGTLRTLSDEEVRGIIQEELTTPEAETALAALSPAGREEFHAGLLALTTRFDGILQRHEREERERQRERDAVEQRRRLEQEQLRQAEAERQFEEEQKRFAEIRPRIEALKHDLETALERKEFERAYDITKSILALDATDAEALKAQEWVEERSGSTITREAWRGFCLPFAFVFRRRSWRVGSRTGKTLVAAGCLLLMIQIMSPSTSIVLSAGEGAFALVYFAVACLIAAGFVLTLFRGGRFLAGRYRRRRKLDRLVRALRR